MASIDDLLAEAGALFAGGDLSQAELLLRQVLSIDRTNVLAAGNLGNVLKQQGKPEEAQAAYRRVLALRPHSFEAHFNLGLIAEEQGRFDEAIHSYRAAVEAAPNRAEAPYRLGNLLAKHGSLAEASRALRRAVELRPDWGEARHQLATVLAEMGVFQEAEIQLAKALELIPDDAEQYSNLGSLLERQGRLDDAVAAYGRAIELKPRLAEAHLGRGLALLLAGNLSEGWPEYEWRLDCDGDRPWLSTKLRWTGASDASARVLLRAEQGLGDTVQFVRYAELVKARCGEVTVECQQPLVKLLSTCRGVDQVVPQRTSLPEFDSYVALASLPMLFDTRLETIPAGIPYIRPNPERVERIRAEWCTTSVLKVGIAWRGSTHYSRDRERSFEPNYIAPMARLSGVQLYSLQYDCERGELERHGLGGVIDLSGRLDDFEDVAALVENLDLVITCDSVLGHLAGALGARVWIALPAPPDWRWMLNRSDSPWYPSVRLFRQLRRGDWQSVFQEMEIELLKLANEKRPAAKLESPLP